METANIEIPEGAVVLNVNTQADAIVKDYVVYSMGAGFVPIPIVDFVGLIGLQVKMVHSLSKLYDAPFSEERVKSILYSILGGAIPTIGTGLLSSVVKFIPIIGQTAGGVSMATLAGASTYAIGKIFIKHFENNGNLEDLDIDNAKEDLKNNIDEAKSKTKTVRKSG